MSGPVHIYPELINHPNVTFLTARSRSADSSITHGFQPPSSSTQGTRFLPASEATILPI